MVTANDDVEAADDIIVCRDVNKWFGEFHVLTGVTTSVKRGEKVGSPGPFRLGQIDVYPGNKSAGGAPDRRHNRRWGAHDQRRPQHRRHSP